MTPSELLEVAASLVGFRGRSGASVVAMRRSISTSYYAVFHALARLCADELVGEGAMTAEWSRVYRALDHGQAKIDLLALAAETKDVALGRVAGTFGNLQLDRHAADYDPLTRFTVSEAESWVMFAREAVDEMSRLEPTTRRHLAVKLLVKARRGRS